MAKLGGMLNQKLNRFVNSQKAFAILLGLLYFFSLSPLISIYIIGSSSEAREVHIAKIMYETGEWILPSRNGLLPSKPPLYHWCIALIGHLTGVVNEFTARLVSLIFASGVIALTAFVSMNLARVRNLRANLSTVAIGAALILSSTYEFLRMSGDARVDMTFCFFVTLALTSMFIPLCREKDNFSLSIIPYESKDFRIFYIACALAVLTKGPLGLALPGFMCLVMTIYLYGFKKGTKLWLVPRSGWLWFLIITVPWYTFAFLKGGDAFILRQVLFENVARVTGGDYMNTEPWWFYGPSFLKSALPWSIVFIYLLLKNLFSSAEPDPDPYPAPRSNKYVHVPALWVLAGVFLFSCASGKRHAYLLPLLPCMSISVGIYLVPLLQAWRCSLRRNLLTVLSVSFAILLFLLEGFSPELGIKELILKHAPQAVEKVTAKLNLEMFALLGFLETWLLRNLMSIQIAILFFLFIVAISHRKRTQVIYCDVALWCGFILLYALICFSGLGIKYNFKDFEMIAYKINQLVPESQKVYAIRTRQEELLDPLLYYLNRDVQVIEPPISEIHCGVRYIGQTKYLIMAHELANDHGLEFQVEAMLNQPLDQLKGVTDREISLFYSPCPSSS